MKIAIVGLLALLLSGCGEEAIWHNYVFLCRTQLEVPSETGPAGYHSIYCQPDLECIARAQKSGDADRLRADGYAVGCPGPGDK